MNFTYDFVRCSRRVLIRDRGSRPVVWSNYTVPDCSASGGSFWDRPPGCACLFWFQSGRGLDCSTSLPRGLRPIAAEPQTAQGGTMEQSSTWAKICHFSEVGHWSRSLAAFFRNFSVIKETHFCGANCVALLQCELRLRQLHLHKIHKSTDNLNWRLRAYELSSSHLHPELSTDALHKLCFAM